MSKEAITSERLREQLRRRTNARLLESRLQVNAALCSHIELLSPNDSRVTAIDHQWPLRRQALDRPLTAHL